MVDWKTENWEIEGMKLTHEHEEVRRTLRRFAEEEINPFVEDWEREGRIPTHELFKKLGNLGLLGMNKPSVFGGAGLDFSYNMVMAEEFGRRVPGGSVPMTIAVHVDMFTPALAIHGSDELRREYLAPSIAGDVVGCIGVTEPSAGSDVAAIKTRATSDGDDYIVNGSKTFITNGVQADWMCCLLNTGDDHPHRNKSLVIIPMKSKGVTVARNLEMIGMMASDTAEIYFEDGRVPKRNRIGPEGEGFTVQMQQFQEERLSAVAFNLGGFEAILELTKDYTRDRKIFGAPILDNQTVHFRLAELSTEIELLRSLLYRAVGDYVAGEDVTRLASMAKLKAGRLGRELTDSCLQYFGGQGYMWETPFARFFRDNRLLSLGGGADEVMLSIICKLDGTLPSRTWPKNR